MVESVKTTTYDVEVTCNECGFKNHKSVTVEPRMILIEAGKVVNWAGGKHLHNGKAVRWTYRMDEMKGGAKKAAKPAAKKKK